MITSTKNKNVRHGDYRSELCKTPDSIVEMESKHFLSYLTVPDDRHSVLTEILYQSKIFVIASLSAEVVSIVHPSDFILGFSFPGWG